MCQTMRSRTRPRRVRPLDLGLDTHRHSAGQFAVVVQSTRAAYVAVPRPRTDLETESWRLLREEWSADASARAEYEAWERGRAQVRPQMLAWLRRFLAGDVGLEQFRSTFDRRTRTDWDAFALKGASGAMYLNALVKHTEHPVKLARRLRAAFRAPDGIEAAAAQLAELVAYVAPPSLALGDGVKAQPDRRPVEPTIEPTVAQPTHAVFLATMCWHLQEPDQWPGFQPSARVVLHEEEELFTASGDPMRDYFLFRESFLSLAAALSLTVWQLEHLCWWHAQRLPTLGDEPLPYDESVSPRPRRRARQPVRETPSLTLVDRQARPARTGVHSGVRSAVRETPPPYVPFTEAPPLDHTHVQWLLAKVGQHLGCRVWIAANDRRREWGGEPLGALSVPRLPPLGMSPDSQRLVSLIDVVWLSGSNQVAAAFEVEHTTSVYSGLLRMADLAALSPNLNFPLYIVAPAARLAKVGRELARPTFRALGLEKRCRFFSSEALLRALPSLARWATGPDAIEKLAERASD